MAGDLSLPEIGSGDGTSFGTGGGGELFGGIDIIDEIQFGVEY